MSAEPATPPSASAETSATGERSRDTSARPEQPVLRKLNRLFHDVYAERAAGIWQQLKSGETPVIVRTGDWLILHSDHEATEYEITGERCHELKAACHIPAAVHLTSFDEDVLGNAGIEQLERRFGS